MDASLHIDELNQRFGVPGVVRVVAGNGGLAKVSMTSPLATGEIYLHGAQVTSWIPVDGDEVIFVSEHSHRAEGRAIRGGIPVCFPWFRGKKDDPAAPAHGFVRTRGWNLESVILEGDGSVVVVCATESDETTRPWWPHEFRLVHRITLGTTLRMELTAENTGSTAFSFEEALHTYFRVSDVERVNVRGLAGVSYLDNMDANREKIQSGDLTLSGPTDSAYTNTHGAVDILDPLPGRVVRTEKESSSTTIVWNPWREGAAKLADLGDDEWKNMICAEAGNILGAAVTLNPGEQHTLCATLSIS
jgi:glucose-6-phosphate 1-epimerase